MTLRIIPLLLLTTILACTNASAHRPTLPLQSSPAEQPEEGFVTLHDAEGIKFQIPSQMLCEEMPERTEGTLIVAVSFPIFSERHDQLVCYVQVVGTEGQTLALGFFRIRQGMNNCYIRLSRGKRVGDIRHGIFYLPRRRRR